MLGTEVQHLLGCFQSADVGTSEHLPTHDQGSKMNILPLGRQADNSHDTTRLQQPHVGININVGADGVQNEVKLTPVVIKETLLRGGQGA